jgi:hypothetical protein
MDEGRKNANGNHKIKEMSQENKGGGYLRD